MDASDAEEHIDSLKVAPTYPTELARWKKLASRAMLIILDGVKDHIVPLTFSGRLWKDFTRVRTKTGRWCP